jgi:hypothetical protein
VKRREIGKSEKLAHSYVPEIRIFGGRNPFAETLFVLADDFLNENRKRIDRLPEKHKAEYFARLWEALSQRRPDKESLFCVTGAIDPVISDDPVLLEKGSRWLCGEQTCRLNEDFSVSGAELKKIILTDPEKQNNKVVYNDVEDFGKFDFSECFEIERGKFLLYFDCGNILSRVPGNGFLFSAKGLDVGVYTDPKAARWFIQSGEDTIPMSAEIASFHKIALKADGGPIAGEGSLTIGVEILDNDFLPYCNFKNPLFSFGMEECFKPGLIIRGGEAREAPFYPFGCPLEEKSDFFVACDSVFSTRGAKVALWLDLRYENFYQPYETLPAIDWEALFENDERYAKAFKNMAVPPKEKVCKAGKASFHYFNGKRFVLLPESRAHESLFAGIEKREFFFTVPDDIEMCEISGVKSYWLRICLEEAPNLYCRPCKIICPRIEKDIQITYGASLEPRNIKRETAAGTRDILGGGVIYENNYGEEPYLYMGFDAPSHPGKLALFIETGKSFGIPAVSGEWEASAGHGNWLALQPCAVDDDTQNFSYPGRIKFDIPEEARKCGNGFSEDNLYWLRTTVIRGQARYPEVKAVYVNAAEFSSSGNCKQGDILELDDDGPRPLKAVAIADSRQSEAGEIGEEQLIRHWISNTEPMINEADISKTLLMEFNMLEEVKCGFDDGRSVSVYLKFKGPDEEDCFDRYGFFIRKRLTENTGYNVRLRRPVKALINVRAAVGADRRKAAALREKLGAFLDYRRGGLNGRGWKIGMLPDESAIHGFFEENRVTADKLVVSARVYAGGSDGNYREYMMADIESGFYASAAGEIQLVSEGKGVNGTHNP